MPNNVVQFPNGGKLLLSPDAQREIAAKREKEVFNKVIAPMVNQIGINAWTFANQQAGAYRYVFRANMTAAKEAAEEFKERRRKIGL